MICKCATALLTLTIALTGVIQFEIAASLAAKGECVSIKHAPCCPLQHSRMISTRDLHRVAPGCKDVWLAAPLPRIARLAATLTSSNIASHASLGVPPLQALNVKLQV